MCTTCSEFVTDVYLGVKTHLCNVHTLPCTTILLSSAHNLTVISCWRKVKARQSLSKMSKPTALYTKGTAQISEWFNISDTAQKLYYGQGNSGIAVVINIKLQTDKVRLLLYQKSKGRREKGKKQIKVQKSGFRDFAKVKNYWEKLEQRWSKTQTRQLEEGLQAAK